MTGDEGWDIELRAGSLRLAARVHGPGDGAPVLALHGWLDNAASFEPLAPLLDGLRIVALDLAGHGLSDHRPPGAWYHFVDYVADVLGAADALGWERFSLLGHSLGGAVATLVAGSCPERIERLALIEALGPISDDPAAAPERLAKALARAGQRGRRAPPVYARLEDAVEARRAAGGLSTAAARRLVERATVATDGGLTWRSDPRLRRVSPYRFTEEQVLACLGAIRAPTLLVAAHDGLLPLEYPGLERRVATLPDAQVRYLAGNHHLHLEDPGPVAALVGPFLRGGDAPAA